MASEKYAKNRARTKSRNLYRSLMKKPKRQIAKIASNFVGKTTYYTALKSKRKKRSRRYR